MHNWHRNDCSQPEIEVLLPNKVPHCRTCDGLPRIAELVAAKAGKSSVPIVPPDGLPGQLRLWWPPSVPYSKNSRASGGITSGYGSLKPEAPDKCPSSLSYKSSLDPDQFRLITLPAVDAYDDPLHITLEAFDLGSCPEYEAVSYTWAGEDGDSSLCHPIYIGPFWDVLLQTKNCWDMLRFARPWRGVRMLWVDAICIDQSNIQERNSQVAHMGQIYSASSRVIIYLGPDISLPLHGRHSRRARLHELESGTIVPAFDSSTGPAIPACKLHDLLKRRYFSRIWVIQELLLSQRIVVRVGDVDFWADAAVSTHFSANIPEWNWERTNAAWVKHIAQGLRTKDLAEILRLTSRSQATDPRDRIFGLLGVLPELSGLPTNHGSTEPSDALSLGGFQADYSLSTQHVFVGLFAYCVLNMRQPTVLYHASCLRVPDYQSWAPDWKLPATWNTLFMSPRFTSHQAFDELIKILEPASDTTPAEISKMYKLQGPSRDYIMKQTSWYQDAHIDSSSGALRLNLTHFMAMDPPIRLAGRIGGFSIFGVQSGKFAMYFLSQDKLDMIIKGQGQEQLFVLDNGNQGLIYLILRPVLSMKEKRYRLIATCPYVMIRATSVYAANEVPTLRAILLEELQHSRYDELTNIHKMLDMRLAAHLGELVPGPKTYRDILPLFLLLREQQQKDMTAPDHHFISIYKRHINSAYSPRRGERHIYIRIHSSWTDVCEQYFQAEQWYDRVVWDLDTVPEYQVGGADEWAKCVISPSKYKRLLHSGPETWINVRFPLSHVYRELIEHGKWILRAMNRILESKNHVDDIGEEHLKALLAEPPKKEDMFINCRGARPFRYVDNSSDLWEEFQMGGARTKYLLNRSRLCQ